MFSISGSTTLQVRVRCSRQSHSRPEERRGGEERRQHEGELLSEGQAPSYQQTLPSS